MDQVKKPNQEKTVFAAWNNPASMLMIAQATGIMRTNITLYVAKWKKSGKIRVSHRAKCEITGRTVNYYTTKMRKEDGTQARMFQSGSGGTFSTQGW